MTNYFSSTNLMYIAAIAVGILVYQLFFKAIVDTYI